MHEPVVAWTRTLNTHVNLLNDKDTTTHSRQALFEKRQIPTLTLLLSEIFPGKLELFTEVECWVQVGVHVFIIVFRTNLISKYTVD